MKKISKPLYLLLGISVFIITIDFVKEFVEHFFNLHIEKKFHIYHIVLLPSIILFIIFAYYTIKKNKIIEYQLEISELKHRLLIEKANDAIIIIKNDKISYSNPAALNLLGYSEEELIGMNIKSICLGKENKNNCIYEYYLNSLNGKDLIDHFEGRFRTKHGNLIYAIITWSKIEINNEILFYGIIKNITQKKQLELERDKLIKELNEKNNKLEKLMKLKDDFIRIASHDLKAPFNAIIGFSEILLNDSDLSETQKQYINIIYESSEIQLSYVEELLELLDNNCNEIKLNLTKISLSELIFKSIHNMEILAQKKSIIIDSSIPEDIFVTVDDIKMIQVINNLISNAIKFTEKNKKISLEAVLINNKMLELHIKDQGIGLDKSRIQNFKNSKKVETTDGTIGEKGSGLGLKISSDFLYAHNTKLMIKSEPGKGSDFYFKLLYSKD
mgnify:CR=1 FL=1